MTIIPTIIDQHADEASFLWILRNAAIQAPHYRLADIVELDNRVEAHIDGLRIAGDAGWEICKKNLTFEESSEVFAAANLALESKDPKRMVDVLDFVESTPDTLPGLISAFGWVEPQKLRGKVKDLLTAEAPVYKHIGIASCAIHRVDPGRFLDTAIECEDIQLKSRALRAVGELKREDLAGVTQEHLSNSSIDCKFWAAWSMALLGKSGSIEVLQDFVESRSKYQMQALQLVLRCLGISGAQSWLKKLSKDSENIRNLIIGTGVVGNTSYIPWIIKQMNDPEQSRVAGEAFAIITGVDIAYDDLEGVWPEGFSAGPTENPEDENVSLDADEDLPMPNQGLIEQWWENHRHEFDSNQRYLCGNPVSIRNCRQVLKNGYQRQRIAAALELALLGSEEILFETRAPSFRQTAMLD